MKITKKLTIYLISLLSIPLCFYLIFNLCYFDFLPTYTIEEDYTNTPCAICSHNKTDAPLLINTLTGEVRELRLYDYDLHDSKKISSKTEYGTMHMGGWSGGSFAAFPDNHYLHLNIQRKSLYKYDSDAAKLFLCSDCLELIENLDPKTNYIISDHFEAGSKFYAIEDICNFTIRHYSFEVIEKTRDFYSLKMKSSYFVDEKE